MHRFAAALDPVRHMQTAEGIKDEGKQGEKNAGGIEEKLLLFRAAKVKFQISDQDKYCFRSEEKAAYDVFDIAVINIICLQELKTLMPEIVA